MRLPEICSRVCILLLYESHLHLEQLIGDVLYIISMN